MFLEFFDSSFRLDLREKNDAFVILLALRLDSDELVALVALVTAETAETAETPPPSALLLLVLTLMPLCESRSLV